jgi:hypothetical protein
MTEDDGRLDALLDQAKPHLLVSVAALILALEGMLLMTVGVQGLLFVGPSGWMSMFPPALLVVGVLTVASAFGLGKIVGPAGWAALLVSALAVLLGGSWFVICALHLVISPAVLLAAAGSPLAFAAVAAAIVPFRRCARARKALARELEGTVPGSGGGGMLAAVVIVGLVLVIGYVVIQSTMGGDPMVVAVVLRGEIDETADRGFANSFAWELDGTGLDGVVAEEPLPADADLDDVRRAGAAVGAAHAVVVDLDSRVEREGVIPGTQLHVVTCSAQFVSTVRGGEPVAHEPLEFALEEATAGDAVSDVGETWGAALTPWVVEQVFASEAFAPVLAGDAGTTVEEMNAARELASMEDAVWERKALAEGYGDYCELEAERLAALREGEIHPTSCLGDPCSQYTLIGVDAAGRAIVQDGSRRPLFKIPLTPKTGWTEKPERIFAVDLANPDDEFNLVRSANFYDFGKLDPGREFASVETFGSNRTEAIYTVELKSGDRRDLALLEPRERTSWILAAPGGEGALVKIKKGPCLLLSANQRIDLPGFRRARWVETPDGTRILGQLDDTAALFELDGSRGSGRLKLRGAMIAAFGDGEGELVVLDKDGHDCRMLRVDASSLSVRSQQEMPECLTSPQLLDDGRLLGIARASLEGDAPGDREVVLWDPRSDQLTPLSSGYFEEETVYPTPDGRRAVFNRRLEDWPVEYDTRTYRRQVCWLDIPTG